MMQVTVLEAQQRLPDLLAAVAAGEEVIIAQQNNGAFKLVPVSPFATKPYRPRPPATGVPRSGSCQGLFVVPDDFDAPLDELSEYMA